MANDDATESYQSETDSVINADEFENLYCLYPMVDKVYEKAKLVLRFAYSSEPEMDIESMKLTP